MSTFTPWYWARVQYREAHLLACAQCRDGLAAWVWLGGLDKANTKAMAGMPGLKEANRNTLKAGSWMPCLSNS